jgi:hypothetical protein
MTYADDLPILATKGEAENLKAKLSARFGEITVDEGRELSYIGM